MKIFIVLIITLSIISCRNTPKQVLSDEWTNTTWINLKEENIKLRIPNQLKATSRYRIKRDFPELSKDSNKLILVQKSLELLEFEDSEIDVLVDTTKAYRMIVICNTQRIDFNKTDASILKKQLKLNNEKSKQEMPTLRFGDITAKMKSNSKHKLARYTTKIQNTLDNSEVFNSIYYLTGDSYSLVVYEFSEDEDSIEKFLWTAKTG